MSVETKKQTALQLRNAKALEAMGMPKGASISVEAQKLKATRLNNAKAMHDMELKTVQQMYAAVGKSIECGEYDAARMKASELQVALGRLNETANRYAELDE